MVGTRPEIIRLASIFKKFDKIFDHRLINANQNQSPQLNKNFFIELGLRLPDVEIPIPEQETFGSFLGNVLINLEKELSLNKPDAFVILGDTNTALAAIVAKRLGIPVYHLEAGNRSFDINVPEEINRRIIDHFADFNLVYTENAKANLVSEGIHPRAISIIGSPLNEVLEEYKNSIRESKIVEEIGLTRNKFILASFHRQENVDDAIRLHQILLGIGEVADQHNLKVVVSTHPRTRKKIDNLGFEKDFDFIWHEPFGFIDYCKLQLESKIVISDSGSISEEAAILGFSAITVRDSMERPEALDSAAILMSGTNSTDIAKAMAVKLTGAVSNQEIPKDYQIRNTSERVTSFITSTHHAHKFWSGLR